jgi:hypothetical protein
MTLHLLSSFRTHIGERGCHFYDEESCTFLSWVEVFAFIKKLPTNDSVSPFADKLTNSLANYDPDHEYLAVCQAEGQVSVELYCDLSG